MRPNPHIPQVTTDELLVGVRTAIALSVIPGLLAALAIVYAIRHAPRAEQREHQPCGCASGRC
jgi:hypothetical protein